MGWVYGGNRRSVQQSLPPKLVVSAELADCRYFHDISDRSLLSERCRNQRLRLQRAADGALCDAGANGTADCHDFGCLQRISPEKLLACPLLCLSERGKFWLGRGRDVRRHLSYIAGWNLRLECATEFLREPGYRFLVLVLRQSVP